MPLPQGGSSDPTADVLLPQAWAILGASVGLVTHTLEFKDMFAAANNTVVWLVVISFFLAKVCSMPAC
jgi:di/tricarboxylate transporter